MVPVLFLLFSSKSAGRFASASSSLLAHVLVLFVFVAALCVPASRAQSTYSAASCSQADIKTAVANELAHPADGDIIKIPSGNCTWTGDTSLQSSFINSVTIQGAGAISSIGHDCSSPTTPANCTTGADQTIILDHFTSTSNATRWILMCANGKTCRITGIAFTDDSNTGNNSNGYIALEATSGATQWRVDHNHFYLKGGSSGVYVGTGGSAQVTGVADHNYFNTLSSPPGIIFDYLFHNGFGWNGGSTSDPNTSWYQAPGFGSANFFFVEDDYHYNTDFADGGDGARYVFRYSIDYCDYLPNQPSQCQMFSHTTREGGRGDYAREIYGNAFTQPGSGQGNPAVSINSGTALVWGNTAKQYGAVATLSNQREFSSDFTFTAPPKGLGYCGPAPYRKGTATVAANSAAVIGSGFLANWANTFSGPNGNFLMIINGATCGSVHTTCAIGTVNSGTSITLAQNTTTAVTNGTYFVGSPWDGNTNPSGYPCLDQPGRTQGQLLSGQTNSNLLNTVTGTQSWPQQLLTPVYGWSNTLTSGVSGSQIIGVYTPSSSIYNAVNNRDFYMDFETYGNSGSFNGTTGVGVGPLSARPSTCTAGTDPALAGSAMGVGYWATDTNTLYVCNPTNTWIAYYTPYTYPHPLVSGGSVSAVNPPSGLTATIQ